jgi:hypothetical protein
LFFLFLAVVSAIRKLKISSCPQAALATVTALFLVSSWVTPVYEMARSVQHFGIEIPAFESSDRVAGLKPDWAARQYMGSSKGVFFRYLAR